MAVRARGKPSESIRHDVGASGETGLRLDDQSDHLSVTTSWAVSGRYVPACPLPLAVALVPPYLTRSSTPPTRSDNDVGAPGRAAGRRGWLPYGAG